jgi:beta-glucanase (GH16 family)
MTSARRQRSTTAGRKVVASFLASLALGGGAAIVPAATAGATVAAARSVDLACPTGRVAAAGFRDVSGIHARAVDCAAYWGVTQGAADGTFGPERPITREQLATFIDRQLSAAGTPLPKTSTDHFRDDDRSSHQGAINRLASAGIVTGTAPGRFSPAAPLTRAQMATVLTRTYAAAAKRQLPAGADAFRDDDGNVHEANIDRLAAARITAGAADGRFVPLAAVTRAQMATFLMRTTDLLVAEKVATVPAAPAPKPAPAPTPAPSPSAPAPNLKLAFADEFSGSSLNTSVWRPYHNTYGDGNKELPCLTPNNVGVSGGTLKIVARRQQITCPGGSVRQFTSGFLGTRETGTYFPRFGRYEIRAKLPHAQGLWPAFWLRHRDGASVAEVDIMEYFHSQVPGKTSQTLHLDQRYNISKKATFFESPTSNPGWHTWAVDIEPAANGAVKFSFLTDGKVVHTYTDTKADWSRRHAGKPLFDMAINMAVGGNWVGHPDDALGHLANLNRCAQGGTAPNGCRTDGIRRATFPTTYEVDYVRVWERR